MKLFLIDLFKRFQQENVMDVSAQCAFYFLLSLFPFMIFAITLLGYLPISPLDVMILLEGFVPNGAFAMIEETIYEIFGQQNPGLLSLGILFAMWTASHAMTALIRSLNVAFYAEQPRPFWKAKLISISLTIGMIMVMLVALIFMVFGDNIGRVLLNITLLNEYQFLVWDGLRLTISFVIISMVFVAIYYFAPNVKQRFLYVLPGALIATIGWLATSFGFSYYVNQFGNYSTTYGSLGAVIVLLLWFQLSAMIIIVGGMINAAIIEKKRGNIIQS